MNKIRVISWIAVIVWIIIIFLFSAQPAQISNKTSGGITKEIAKILVKDFKQLSEIKQQKIIDEYQYFIRKTAHGILFYVLFILCFIAMLTYKKSTTFKGGMSFLISFLTAIQDELHQIFVPGRAPMIRDVMIDTIGIIIGVSTVIMFRLIFNCIKRARSQI